MPIGKSATVDWDEKYRAWFTEMTSRLFHHRNHQFPWHEEIAVSEPMTPEHSTTLREYTALIEDYGKVVAENERLRHNGLLVCSALGTLMHFAGNSGRDTTEEYEVYLMFHDALEQKP